MTSIVLWRLKGDDCSIPTLREALRATCVKRGSATRIARRQSVLDEVESDQTMLSLWAKYAKKNPYASDVDFPQCCAAAKEILEAVA